MAGQAARSGRWEVVAGGTGALRLRGGVDFSLCERGSHWRALHGVWLPVTKTAQAAVLGTDRGGQWQGDLSGGCCDSPAEEGG